jgi:hypothetical protein
MGMLQVIPMICVPGALINAIVMMEDAGSIEKNYFDYFHITGNGFKPIAGKMEFKETLCWCYYK